MAWEPTILCVYIHMSADADWENVFGGKWQMFLFCPFELLLMLEHTIRTDL